MKILRKNDEFKKMSDSNMIDMLKIDNLVEQGWKYCTKKDYKDFFRTKKVEVVQTENSDIVTKSGKKKLKRE